MGAIKEFYHEEIEKGRRSTKIKKSQKWGQNIAPLRKFLYICLFLPRGFRVLFHLKSKNP